MVKSLQDRSPVAPWLALSLREPWLTAVLDLGKRIENRRWNTSFRGRFLLHAAKAMTCAEYADACEFIRRIGCSPPERSRLRSWGIVGVATMVGVIRPGESADCAQGVNLAWWMPDQYGFVLRDVVALPELVRCPGALGFFRVPDFCEGSYQRSSRARRATMKPPVKQKECSVPLAMSAYWLVWRRGNPRQLRGRVLAKLWFDARAQACATFSVDRDAIDVELEEVKT
jgi:hypothetical protein